jgi:hypothetical protein
MPVVKQPGQTVSTRQNTETEVTIAVKQARVAALAGGILAFAAQRLAVIPVCAAIAGKFPAFAAYAVEVEVAIGTVMIPAAILFPLWDLWISMRVQVHDGNWPPPRKAQAAEDGPNAPRHLRSLSGWNVKRFLARFLDRLLGWRETEEPPVWAEESYAAPIASVDAPPPADQVIDTTIRVRNGKHLDITRPRLTMGQWRQLRRVVLEKDCSISSRDLRRAGLKKDVALAINSGLTECKALLESREGEHKSKRFPIPAFVEYLRNEQYKTMEALPHPENGA